MKILLDECVDERLAYDFAGHDVLTVRQMGWKGKQNGELLALAEKQFEAFVTTDRNLSFQQNLTRFRIAGPGPDRPQQSLKRPSAHRPRIIESGSAREKGRSARDWRVTSRGRHLRGVSCAGGRWLASVPSVPADLEMIPDTFPSFDRRSRLFTKSGSLPC